MAFDLKLEYEGVEKGELVRRIILTLEQRGQLEQLIGWLQTNRADIDIAPFKLDPTPGRTVSKPSAPSRSEAPAPLGGPKPTSPSPQPAAAGQGSSFRAWMVVAAVLLVSSTWLVRQWVGQPASEPSTVLSTPTVRPTSRPAQPAQTQSPAAKTISPVTANAQWAPQFQSFDGVQMALVPPGCFTMGTQDAGSGGEDERPTARLCFDQPFWIDKTEVTQAQFKRLGGQAANAPGFAGDNRPVERITWFEARDFCVKRGARLPTEAEWEYAARGPDNLVYPWGNTFDGNKVVYSQNSNSQTADVGSRPAGASWVGALDMSGNVWEWVSSLYKPYPYEAKDGRESLENDKETRVLRGGSWFGNYELSLRAAFRLWLNPTSGGLSIGFRCARSS